MPEVLSKSERQGAVFQKIDAYYRDRLLTLRSENDGNLDPVATAKVRGRIAEVKYILALGLDPVAVPDDPLDRVPY